MAFGALFWGVIFEAKGPMTHGTFNARNCDAGLRGVAFDAGAFDSWKIDA